MKALTFYTMHDISSAYSCLTYLKDELQSDYDIKIWSGTLEKNCSKENFINQNIFSFYTKWFGKIPKIRVILIHLFVLYKMIFSKSHILINDLDFVVEAYIAKKIDKNKKVILYFTEIYGKDISLNNNVQEFYKKRANFPDIIIECLNDRAEYRKKELKINKEIFVIDNTIPCNSIKLESLSSNEITKYLDFENDYPIIAFAGGCTERGNLDELIDELSIVKEKFNLVIFCYGTDNAINHLKEQCEKKLKKGTYIVNNSVQRNKLLSILKFADIGVVFYDPKFSTNYYYAAPSKFYEYLYVGLNILSTNNRGINHIIANNNIGVCIMDDEPINEAVTRLLNKEIVSKQNIKDLFESKYCYEISASKAIEEIKKIV